MATSPPLPQRSRPLRVARRTVHSLLAPVATSRAVEIVSAPLPLDSESLLTKIWLRWTSGEIVMTREMDARRAALDIFKKAIASGTAHLDAVEAAKRKYKLFVPDASESAVREALADVLAEEYTASWSREMRAASD
jgi:hypothetical protein